MALKDYGNRKILPFSYHQLIKFKMKNFKISYRISILLDFEVRNNEF